MSARAYKLHRDDHLTVDLVGLVALTLLISPSGALAPGPLTVASITEGARGRWIKAGLTISIGHASFELPYILALSVLASGLEFSTGLLKGMGIASSGVMLFFAAITIRGALHPSTGSHVEGRRPFAAGLLMTAINPYFLLWWIGVGWPLVIGAMEGGLIGYIAMYTSHVWYDFTWLALMAYLGDRGARMLETRGYKIFLAVLAAILLMMAADMLSRTLIGSAIFP